MQAVILDDYVLRPGDLDWSGVEAMVDQVRRWPRTPYEHIAARIGDAELVITNKCRIDEAVLRACPRIRWIGLTATGTDSLDLAACRRHGVPVSNVPAYSTESVAQMTTALLLSLCHSPARFDAAVRAGCWQTDIPASCGILPLCEVWGKTLGLVGCGAIGRRVAQIAGALGMRVLATVRTPRAPEDGVRFVPLETLLAESDFLSLHCPATPETAGLLNARTLALCRRGVRIVNTARGALVDEEALCTALADGQVGAYAADVAAREPIPADSPLLRAPHTLLTPHIAWATPEALARLTAAVCANLAAFLAGQARNVVN